jgi:hypothetical protein
MALGSNAPRCAAGDCREQLRFDVHQLHHEGLLMVGRVLVGTQNDGTAMRGLASMSKAGLRGE